MDQNNMGGMNFVMGGDSVPEDIGVNQTLTNMVNQPQVQNVQSAPVQENTAPTLSSVMPQPQEMPNNVQPTMTMGDNSQAGQVQQVVNNPVSDVSQPQTISSAMPQPQEIPNYAPPVNEMSQPQTISNVIPQPQEMPNNVQPTMTMGDNSQAGQVQQVVNNPVSDVDANVVQPNPSTDADVLEDAKQNKIKKILIGVIAVLTLTIIGILIGFMLFNKFGNAASDVIDEATTSISNVISANAINNVDVDNEQLSSVLQLLGISMLANKKNIDSLTYYVTDENFRDNIKDIIVHYAVLGSDIVLSSDDYKDDSGACGDAINCAIISKSDAEKILKSYNVDGNIDDYFYKSTSSDDVYGIRYDDTLELEQFAGNNLGIGHDLTAKYIGDNDIDVEDTQIFNYNDDEKQFKSVNRVVKYSFKKDDLGEYYLDNVLISE